MFFKFQPHTKSHFLIRFKLIISRAVRQRDVANFERCYWMYNSDIWHGLRRWRPNCG